jgi:beta-galactosidase/beta-glucuronidase
MTIPRKEYPRPDFARENWRSLNGEWEFAEDYSVSGRARGMQAADAPAELFDQKIIVPFCRESELSGLGHKDFCNCVWYRKKVRITAAQLQGRVLFRVGACDWRTEVFVNGVSAGTHTGGYVEFAFDITSLLRRGDNVITICADDDLRSHDQAAGKQSDRYASYACSYTRTTGIWQSVWLEFVPKNYIKSIRVFPDVADRRVAVEFTVVGDGRIAASAYYEGRQAGYAEASVCCGTAVLTMELSELHLWELGQGRLYDLCLTFGGDRVKSYFGMRSVETKDGFLYLNGRRVFQRLVLDQGFYPDGIYTASSDRELLADIERSMACGFNGARLHQKIFEPRFLYYADRLGYMVWGEHANWVLDISRPAAWANFIPEWIECLTRDFNHPAIIGWCPLNETQRNQDETFVRSLAAVTRTFDPTRAYIDTSGWCHVPGVTDIMDNHDYEQDPAVFRATYEAVRDSGAPVRGRSRFQHSTSFVSEYGGIRWAPEGSEFGWGYGNAPKTGEEFIARFRGLTDALLDNSAIGGLCYTQLTDVEQEVNGLYTYGRRAKFDPAIFKEILSRKAVIED